MSAQVLSVLDIELVDRVYQDVFDSYVYTKGLIGVMTQEDEVIALLQSKSVQDYDRVIKGLVYGVLANEEWVRYLAFTNRDQYQVAAATLERLLLKIRTYERAKGLLVEVWKQNSQALHNLITTFMRVTDLTSILRANIDWVCQQPSHLPAFVFYRTLKMLFIHSQYSDPLLQDDIIILTQLWTKRKSDCFSIGKDVVLMLSHVSGVQEIEGILSELNASGAAGLVELLNVPTSWSYQFVLLDPISEEKIKFVMEKVNPASIHRYMIWITAGLPEYSIPDLARFVLTYESPSTNPTSRWHILLWLLNFTPDREIQAKIKLAFVFDLVFFNESEGLRLIEPLLSFIQTGVVQKPEAVDEMLHFLILTVENFQANLQTMMLQNVKNGLKIAEAQGVISPIDTLLREGAISPDIRVQLQNLLSRQQVPQSPELEFAETDEEDVTLSVPEVVITACGDAAKALALAPTIDRVKALVHLCSKVDEPLADFVLKSIMHELVGDLTQFISEDSLLFHIFQAAEHDMICRELVRIMRAKESGIGVRLLVYSARTGSNLYFNLDPKDLLEKDLQSGLLDMTLETLNWLFPYGFEHMNSYITPSIIHFFLQVASQELLVKVECDLLLKKYSLLQDKIKEVFELAGELTNIEQLYLWKLILAEVSGDKMDSVIEGVHKSVMVTSHWELVSGLVTFIGKWPQVLSTENTKTLLMFPSKHFAQAIYIALLSVKPSTIEEAILNLMQKAPFHAQINVLRHIKYWFENGLKLRKVVKSRAIQEVLGTTLQSLSSEYFKEFSGVLEGSRPGYTS